jgi:hypothetical protein
MLSSAYQMSSGWDARAGRVDPEDRLLWRFTGGRLEAEEIRDSLLAVSGLLDRTMGGTLLTLKNREYFFDHTSRDQTRYESRRRSVYLPVVRNHLYDVFQLFDFGDASVPEGNRPTTTVAPQALFMLNSDLVLDASQSLANSLLARADLDTAGRLRLLFLRAHGRPPTHRELAQAQALLSRFGQGSGGVTESWSEAGGGSAANTPSLHHSTTPAPAPARAWAWLCQTVLAANEFVFVR